MDCCCCKYPKGYLDKKFKRMIEDEIEHMKRREK